MFPINLRRFDPGTMTENVNPGTMTENVDPGTMTENESEFTVYWYQQEL